MTQNKNAATGRRSAEEWKTGRDELERRINALAVQWRQAQAAGDDARASALYDNLWIAACDAYERYYRKYRKFSGNEGWVEEWYKKWYKECCREWCQDAFYDAMAKTIKDFSPEEGRFTNLLTVRHWGAFKDLQKKDKIHAPGLPTLDAPVSEEDDTPVVDTIAQETWTEDGRRMLGGMTADLAALILNFARSSGKKNNERSRMWFSLFFTEDVTRIARRSEPKFQHETDIFHAMELEYLDYYMSEQCRTCMKISRTPLKPYGQVVPGKSGEIPLDGEKFPADVSLAFLKCVRGISAADSARSNQKAGYDELKRSLSPSGR